MADINNATITGRMTRDLDVKDVGGAKLLTGSIANNRSVKKNGEWVEETSFFEFKMWSRSEKQAGFFKRTLCKGATLVIEGSYVQERWEKDGQKQSRVVLLASNIIPTGKGTSGGSVDSDTGASVSSDDTDGFPEDLPF